MKTYKINNSLFNSDGSITVTADQIKTLIKDNPELLEEKKVSGRYFFPKEGEEYYTVGSEGDVIYHPGYNCIVNHHIEKFKTKDQAELARDKQRAIVACWKWQQENAPFEPDWSNKNQNKYLAFYKRELNRPEYTIDLYCQTNFTLPYFKSRQDCLAFIEANKAHLELLFTK